MDLASRFQYVNDEVFYAPERIVSVDRADVEALKAQALKNPRRRARLCAHHSVDDTLHEMLIAHAKDIYVRPHKHINKSESFHIIEGELSVMLFNEEGGIVSVIEMSPQNCFFYRLSESAFHTVVPTSDMVVFHETTNGPFNRSDTMFAPWSPEENDVQGQKTYMETLRAMRNEV
ncbi:WbuC family cupin fold metalloprotein [Candidatus Magnetomonas plexicatena]|uniref:WbuC family cupin fold metalloprotein n=1 Tax=Candidatus Magnetomonas plexicatena TaxID=2552947 RepID=UPI004032F9F1